VRKRAEAIILFVAAASYTLLVRPPPIKEALKGSGYFSIHRLKTHASPFQRSLLYQGELTTFITEEGAVLKKIPISVKAPKKGKRPTASSDYIIKGVILEDKGRYLFKPDPTEKWHKQPETFSFAEWRYKAKQKITSYLKKNYAHRNSQKFLGTLVTGDLEERSLALNFNRLGLQHLLAISGFHFSLIALFCGFFLKALLPRKAATLLLLILLSAYFFLIGPTPSIQRAWIGISLYLIGKLCNLHCPGLNALGVALIAAIILDPLSSQTIGFQLSFLVTAAILLLYPACEAILKRLLPKRSLSEILEMSRLDQHGYILSATIRKALALTCAVQLVALPVSLYLFHQFPLLSIAYNLFFPVAVSLSLFLLFLALPLSWLIPPMGTLLHRWNDNYTATILQLCERPPIALHYSLYTPHIPLPLLLLLLAAIFYGGIIWHERKIYAKN